MSQEKVCLICEESKSGDMVSKCSSCKEFLCHNKCFENYYDFNYCLRCFHKIEQPPLKFQIIFTNFFSSSKKLEILERLKNHIEKQLKKLFNYNATSGYGFGQTITIMLPRTGDLWECTEINEEESAEVKTQINQLLKKGNSFIQ